MNIGLGAQRKIEVYNVVYVTEINASRYIIFFVLFSDLKIKEIEFMNL